MTDLPLLNDLVGASTTEADFQSALSALYNYVKEQPQAGVSEEKSIVLGSITPSLAHIIVDTENQSAADDLTNIVPNNLGTKLIFLQCKSSSRPVTLKHNSSGTGKLNLLEDLDVILNDPKQIIILKYHASTGAWKELWRNFGIFLPNETLKSSLRTSLGLGQIVTKAIGTSSDQVPTADLLGALAFLASVGTSQISNNAVTTAKLQNDSVTLAKMAHGNANKYIGYNASGIPTELDPPSSSGAQYIYSTDTFTVPNDISVLEVYLIGAGGQGGDLNGNGGNGASGGTTSFGTIFSATGGNGGGGQSTNTGGTGGNGVDGDVNIKGENGESGGNYAPGGLPYQSSYFSITEHGYGTAANGPQVDRGGGGGAGGFAFKHITGAELDAIKGTTITVTIGVCGDSNNRAIGGPGACFIRMY